MKPMDMDGLESGAIIADLARRAAEALTKPVTPPYKDAAPFIVLRDVDGRERVVWLKDRLDDPKRKSGTVKLQDAPSFIDYYKVHGNGAPVYASIRPARFLAVLNEHTKDAPGWRDHRADFLVAHSTEWDTWTKHNGAGAAFNSNESFALFLEDNAPDIVKPDPAKMLSIALNFRVNADVQFSVAQRLQDGHVQFGYNNVVSAEAKADNGHKFQIPESFEISVPVFAGINAKKYKVEARFRYRLKEGRLTLWYELVRPQKVVEQAFKDVWDEIKKETKAPILLGTPE